MKNNIIPVIISAYTAYEDGTDCSETSAHRIQTKGNHPKERIQLSSLVPAVKRDLTQLHTPQTCYVLFDKITDSHICKFLYHKHRNLLASSFFFYGGVPWLFFFGRIDFAAVCRHAIIHSVKKSTLTRQCSRVQTGF
jgi:hypothetical protein